jgi:LPS O-antigen subunit length determinant protein (WzzB/FepE family)
MKNNNPNNYIQEDEIDLKKFIKLLINSKKLIILITLIITTLGAIYAAQKIPQYISTVLIEIGSYDLEVNDLEVNDYGNKIIEPVPSLIQNLTINFIHKQEVNVEFREVEDRLIRINTHSYNLEKNIDLLNKIIGYIKNRQSNLIQKIAYQITSEIKLIDIEIEFFNNMLSHSQEKEKLRISYLIENQEGQAIHLSNERTDLKQKLFNLSREKNEKKLELEFLMQKSPISTQLIGKIVTQTIDAKKELIIFWSFILGLFLSIPMVLIFNFLKAFKDKYA